MADNVLITPDNRTVELAGGGSQLLTPDNRVVSLAAAAPPPDPDPDPVGRRRLVFIEFG